MGYSFSKKKDSSENARNIGQTPEQNLIENRIVYQELADTSFIFWVLGLYFLGFVTALHIEFLDYIRISGHPALYVQLYHFPSVNTVFTGIEQALLFQA